MSILPSGYKRLEYIQSTGTQYVDTKLSIPNGFHVITDWMYTEMVWRMNSLNNRDLLGSLNSLEIDLITEIATVKLTGVSAEREA